MNLGSSREVLTADDSCRLIPVAAAFAHMNELDAEKYVESRRWAYQRAALDFQSLTVRCLFLQFDREQRHSTLRGLGVFTKFAPDSFHFLLFLKAL